MQKRVRQQGSVFDDPQISTLLRYEYAAIEGERHGRGVVESAGQQGVGKTGRNGGHGNARFKLFTTQRQPMESTAVTFRVPWRKSAMGSFIASLP